MPDLDELRTEADQQVGYWKDRGEYAAAMQWQNILSAVIALTNLRAKWAAEDLAGPVHRKPYA